MNNRRLLSLQTVFILSCLYGDPAAANPVSPVVAHGEVSFDASRPGRLSIANNPNAIINWQGFSIARNEVTRFIQPNSNSAVLNRVIGQDPSRIMGKLISKGRIYLINPNGIVFGRRSVVDTAGFLASTLNISNHSFRQGTYVFSGEDTQGIENHGLIQTGEDGNILLIASDIENDGILQNDGGRITLAAGKALTISSLDTPEVNFKIQAPGDQVLNLGQMLSNGGAIHVFAGTLIGKGGEINANAMSRDGEGNIVLEAQDSITMEQSVIKANGSLSIGVAGTIPSGGSLELLTSPSPPNGISLDTP